MNRKNILKKKYYFLYVTYLKNIEKFSIKKIIKYRNKKVKRIVNQISYKNSLFVSEINISNIKNIIQHLIDFERFITYKETIILRTENKNLNLFFNVNKFFEEKKFKIENIRNRSFKSLKLELFSLYTSTYYFFENLSNQELKKIQIFQGDDISVELLAYISCGYTLHYCELIKKQIILKKL